MSIDLLQQGIQAYKSGQKEKAVAIFTDAVRQTPDSAWAWFWLGKVLDEPEKKKYCFDRAMQIDPALREKLKSPNSNNPSGISNEPTTTATQNDKLKPKKSQRQLFVFGGIGVSLVLGCVILSALGVLNGTGTRSIQLLQNLQTSTYQPNLVKALTNNQTLPTQETPPSPTVTLTRTPSPIPSSTPTTDPTEMYGSLGFQVTAARVALDTKRFDVCVQSYNNLLTQMPSWTSGNYNRGVCKRGLALKSRNLSEFHDLVISGIADGDKAISIGPVKGIYFAERSYQYNALRSVFENSPTDKALLQIALENIQTAIRLGDIDTLAQTNLSGYLIDLGMCQEGVEEAKRQMALIPSDQPPIVPLYDFLARGYLCLGDYEHANQVINQHLQIEADCDVYQIQTSGLIGLGQKDQAFEVIDRCIKGSPEFGGYRYYLRSLLNWDRGEKELAHQDLDTGSGNTWYHGGLYAYIAGIMAIDNGDQAGGLELLKYAESTVKIQEGLWVRERIRASLASLNIPQQNPTPAATFAVTPIIFEQLTPAAPVPQSPMSDVVVATVAPAPAQPDLSQSGNPVPDGYLDSTLVDFNVGTGPLDLAPGDYPLFHFRPTYPIPVRLAKGIHFSLTPTKSGKPPVQVYLWVKEGGWRMLEPRWGDNEVEFPSFYISSSGDTYIAIRNYSPNITVHIDNASLKVTAELSDGEIKTYGLGN